MLDSVEASGVYGLSSVLVKRTEADINWVAVAVEMAGGVQTVARKIGVSRWTVYKWIECGSMRRIAYGTVVKLQELSGVPIDRLTQE